MGEVMAADQEPGCPPDDGVLSPGGGARGGGRRAAGRTLTPAEAPPPNDGAAV